jgi:anti-sigma28 factor (negative regulator of flagellin synthesis)
VQVGGVGETALSKDSVEISELAGFLNRLAQLPDARAKRIVEVRNAIESGQYETQDKLDITTERLLDAFSLNT